MNYKMRKAINFDLSTKSLKMYYPKSRRNAYREIGKFLKENGFFRRQWSGYMSKDKMSVSDIADLTEKMFKKLPWLEQCANKIDVTDIGKQCDLILLYNTIKNNTIEIEKINTFNSNEKKLFSRDELKKKTLEMNNNKSSINKRNERGR